MGLDDVSATPTGHGAQVATGRWWPWPLAVLVVLTAANYVWQVPYYLHFYGRVGRAPAGLTVPLLLTGVWFVVAAEALSGRRRHGRALMVSFLVVEVVFYLVHNATGAAGRDLPLHDPVLFVASVLGYLNLLYAAGFLVWLLRRPRSDETAPAVE